MFVPSLLNLSTKVVAKCLAEGRYRHFNINLNAKLSDQIFYEIVKLPSLYKRPHAASSFAITEKTGLRLNLTKFDTDRHPVSCEDLVNLHRHNIQSLTIVLYKILGQPEYRIKTGKGRYKLDIFRILKTCLNERSRQNLRHLSCDSIEHFPHGWTEKVGELLPNLVTFAPYDMNDMTGIRHLKNLQTLFLYGLELDSTEDLEELFKLPNLQALDLTYCDDLFENLLLYDRSFQNLKLIDCYKSDITEAQLREMVRRNPSLETIALLDTPCDETDFSDLPITVLNLANYESTMKTLRYTLDRSYGNPYPWEVDTIIDRLGELLHNETIQGFKEDEFLKLIMEMTREYPPSAEEKNRVAACLIPYFKN
uniref:Mitochondrial ATP synthase regulatory component factor B n=2 Tax=Caenorhabditis tropicalis TaxID=1561998 RepID=A0A1I7TVM5_9PELO